MSSGKGGGGRIKRGKGKEMCKNQFYLTDFSFIAFKIVMQFDLVDADIIPMKSTPMSLMWREVGGEGEESTDL